MDAFFSLSIAERKSLFYETYRNQDFAFSGSLMYYIAKNPLSPKVYQKMIKSCKFFFVKNPLLVLSNLYYANNGWVTWSNGNRTKVDLNGLEKYWVAEYFWTCSSRASAAASIVPRISLCNVQRLSLANQIISYNDLMILAKDVEDLTLNKVFVRNEVTFFVTVDKIFDLFPKVKRFFYTCTQRTPDMVNETFGKFLKNPNFLALDVFTCYRVSDNFDIEAFYAYMESNKHTKINLEFAGNISVALKNRLEQIVDEILSTQNHGYKPPFLDFHGLAQQKLNAIRDLSFSA
jgi:hypothetical protein